MLRHPHRKRTQPPQRQEYVVGAGTDAEQINRLGDQRPCLGVGRNGAEHDVGMAADIFGRRLHADIDALIQRAMIQRRRPGVVVDDKRATCMRDRCDRGNVGHFEGLRARGFDQHRPGIGLEQAGDAGADQRIEIADLDAVTGEDAIAEIAGGTIGIVADQQVIAGLQHREQGGGDRGQARGRDTDAGALRAFERHQRLLQCLGGRGSPPAILEFAAMGMQIRCVRIQHGGTVDDGRIDEALLRLGVAARRHQDGFGLERARWPAIP